MPGLGAAVMLLTLLGMMVIPMPPVLLDLMFSFNIALSIVILLAVVYVSRPLEFSVFPTILLVVTLLRLSLNVASTRVVLLNGHEGTAAAGNVIEAFGEFVIGGNYAVGLVVFAILTIINFVVVTKGAERISEVSARFTLDAMPGKQMAIDADLNAGLLSNEEARARRDEVRDEADFYGSMDGASKFVRGDALAGLLILFINLIGGLIIGMAQHGLDLAEAGRTYSLLTIGDGLVAQLPGLMLSTAVAILVTRMSQAQNVSQQVVGQLFGSPRALIVTAGMLTLLGVIPGMPNTAFLLLAAACGALAYWRVQQQRKELEQSQAIDEQPAETAPSDVGWHDVEAEDPLGLELGYRLIPLVDTRQGGDLMARIKAVRRKLTKELGFLVPAVHIRDRLELAPTEYRVLLFGSTLARVTLQQGKSLALSSGQSVGELKGIKTTDPVFGLDAWWIDPADSSAAQAQGYTVVDLASVMATHLSHLIQQHANEIFGHDEAQQLVDRLAETAPRLVEDLIPKKLSLASLVRVIQSLLSEGIPIKNLRGILEAVSDVAGAETSVENLTAVARRALRRQILESIAPQIEELPVMTLDPALERMLQDAARNEVMEPGVVERMHESASQNLQARQEAGEPAVLLVPDLLRPWLARLLRGALPALHVLSYNEMPEQQRIRVVGSLA
ncbi:MAG: flagellar biosynthesis protein FlhA [Oceanococcus sp.]